MEDGLRALHNKRYEAVFYRLNPCCYGRWSQSYETIDNYATCIICVLILVVMEDGLRDSHLEEGDSVDVS